MHCCQRSSCTPQTVKGLTMVATGVGLISIIPLVMGCLGTYGHLKLAPSISRACILSGSIGCTFVTISTLSCIVVHSKYGGRVERWFMNRIRIVKDMFKERLNSNHGQV